MLNFLRSPLRNPLGSSTESFANPTSISLRNNLHLYEMLLANENTEDVSRLNTNLVTDLPDLIVVYLTRRLQTRYFRR